LISLYLIKKGTKPLKIISKFLDDSKLHFIDEGGKYIGTSSSFLTYNELIFVLSESQQIDEKQIVEILVSKRVVN